MRVATTLSGYWAMLLFFLGFVGLSNGTLFAQTGNAIPERHRAEFLRLADQPLRPHTAGPYRNFKFQVDWGGTAATSSTREHILLARQVGHLPGPIVFLQPTVLMADTIGHTFGLIHEHQNPTGDMDQDGIDDLGLWLPDTQTAFGGYRPQFYFPMPDVSGSGKPLLIIAEDVEGEALSGPLHKPDVIILDEPTGTADSTRR